MFGRIPLFGLLGVGLALLLTGMSQPPTPTPNPTATLQSLAATATTQAGIALVASADHAPKTALTPSSLPEPSSTLTWLPTTLFTFILGVGCTLTLIVLLAFAYALGREAGRTSRNA